MTTGDYYDSYVDRQVAVGVNDRHRAIQGWLRRFGLRPGMDVLEIGCGIGTVTGLIAETLKGEGTLLAIDPSSRSIEVARGRLGRARNVDFLVADAVDVALDRTFDVIVLPDVLEHIPVERHAKLFSNIRAWLRDTGWVLIHMPNPAYLEWCRRHRPDLLQEIDQPIHIEILADAIRSNGLAVHYLNTYSIWLPEPEYQVVVLRVEDATFSLPSGTPMPGGLIARTTQWARGRISRYRRERRLGRA
jgi:trans-aconitate 2-methyltransferase